MTSQMTGTGHNPALVSRHFKSPLSRQQPLSWLKMGPQTVRRLSDPDQHHLLSERRLRFKIVMAVSNQHRPDREQLQDLHESQMRPLHP